MIVCGQSGIGVEDGTDFYRHEPEVVLDLESSPDSATIALSKWKFLQALVLLHLRRDCKCDQSFIDLLHHFTCLIFYD